MNNRNIKLTEHSGTFACPNAQAIASQTKEPEYSYPLDHNTND